ncbi:ribose-5-phosphate isomerase RpiA [Alteribacter populi]|uniref:ribose-5-phosphate isomerase RpiA n=1 Tax=Alteribacter populi TaxID=2011011 RepID=UPI002477E586|nr:ribose-5-phosphate isomerase RpiA [Alteribacter populi]
MNVENMKRQAGEKAVEYIHDGMTLGLGSGTTVNWMVKKLGDCVREGLNVRAVSSSVKTEKLAHELGIPLVDSDDVNELDLAIDGADEADEHFNLIKGGGGSLLREKMVLELSEKKIIIIDEQKRVSSLGKFHVPVEITPFSWKQTWKKVTDTGCLPTLRKVDDQPFVTDNGNYILDCDYHGAEVNQSLHETLKMTTGVLETGIFTGLADVILTGHHHGVSIHAKN